MKQILQNARSGALELVDVPAPMPGVGMIIVQNLHSVMSPGTDKLAMSFARMSMLGKARSRPDLVKQVVKKLSQEGPAATYRTVTSRLDSPQPLGYSSAGVVRAVGEGVTDFSVGDRVACAGAGYANHAELIAVPTNLVVHVPDDVELNKAAFTTLGAIAMQGVRVADPTLGEVAAVVGLGLVGQLTVQLLRANGCRVLGLDLDSRRMAQSLENGAEWAFAPDEMPDSWADQFTAGLGVDLAVVTAASSSSTPLAMAAELCRKKGRIAFVGAMPIELDRRVMFEKELDLRMSTSYGPGRYDRRYEEQGFDYPVSYVRWTENRNMQAFVDLIASRSIDPSRLDTEPRSFSDAVAAYEELESGRATSLAVVFDYEQGVDETRTLLAEPDAQKQATPRSDLVGVSFIGAGNYAKAVLLPHLKDNNSVERITLVTATGPSARQSARTYNFRGCSTESEAVFKDPNVDFVFITTQHDTHVDYAVRALEAKKGVWLEKPTALDEAGLGRVAEAVRNEGGFLAVGYNRRFSSHTKRIQSYFEGRQGPIKLHYRVVSPTPPLDSWLMDPRVGGGRVVGEGCHFVDLCHAVIGARCEAVFARTLTTDAADDTYMATLIYEDGSVATLDYLANASPDIPKEYFEVSADGRTARCENFRKTRFSGTSDYTTFNQDKGQGRALEEVLGAYGQGLASPLSLEDIINVSRVTFAIEKSAADGGLVTIEPDLGPPAQMGEARE